MKKEETLKEMAFEEIRNEIAKDIETRENEYDRLEINRIKQGMKEDLDFSINGHCLENKENNSGNIYIREHKLKEEIGALKYKLQRLDNLKNQLLND